MKKIKEYIFAILEKGLPLRIGFTNLALGILQMYYLFKFNRKDGLLNLSWNPNDILVVIYSFITLNIFIQLINIVGSKSRKLRVFSSVTLLILYNYLYSYHYRAKTRLDFALLIENLSDAFYTNSLDTIFSEIGLIKILAILAILGIFLFFEYKKRLISRQRQERPLFPKFLLMGCIYLSVVILPITTHDELTYFFKTAYLYYFQDTRIDVNYKPFSYPFIKENTRKHEEAQTAKRMLKPNVFIIMMESFNANHVDAKSPEGKEYTPVFNSHIKDGLYIEKFYGNSIQTCRGQFATFFSTIESIKGKVFVNYPDNDFYSLPQVLRDFGYETIFFQADPKVNFDNTYYFLTKNGFSVVKSVKEYLKKEDKKDIWGWGPQDDVFYRRFFEYLDEKLKEDSDVKKKPLFVTLATISNHMMFNKVPQDRRFLYAKPRNTRESYANSIYLADMGLKQFFDDMKTRGYLENSIIIITGDHSFPVGEHGYSHNEVGFYEEFFRTPFLLIWKGKVVPTRIKYTPYSQMDIAPTLVDLMNIPVERHHFQGVSIFDEEKQIHPIYLVQPYNGKYLSVVYYPFKYVKSLRTGAERGEVLYNLDADPRETTNLVEKKEYSRALKFMQEKIQLIYLNQKLIEENEIWHQSHGVAKQTF